MKKTENFALNQWEATDKLSRSDFNSDNAAIDAALVNKANAADVTALSQSVSTLSAALGSGGSNCRIAWGSYKGTGVCGEGNPNKLTFAFKPLAVWVAIGFASSGNSSPNFGSMVLINPVPAGEAGEYLDVTWSANGVQWSVYGTDNAALQFNDSDYTYYWVAVGV